MAYHSASKEDVLSGIGSAATGLSSDEAQLRLSRDGRNSISIRKRVSPLGIFISQFKNSLVLLLLFAAFVSLGLSIISHDGGEALDSALIFAIVLANASFGFFQEYKAERSIEMLSRMSAP